MFGMMIFWVLLIVAAIWLVKQLFRTSPPDHPGNQIPSTPDEILDNRYRRGEINLEQYRQMKKDLSE